MELRDGDFVLDAVGYGSFGAGDVFAGEGVAAPDGPAGTSLARVYADIDTNDNAADFELLAVPTPGEADFAYVPEPNSGSLFFSGLALLAGLRRRRAVSAAASRPSKRSASECGMKLAPGVPGPG